jgi:outer membrane scaffolding protein for murein synthesis (MipA/OmpV family)
MKLTKIYCCLVLMLFFAVGPALAGKYTAGLGAGFAPDYEGSDEYEGVPALMLKGNYDSGRSFALVGTNLKVNLLTSKSFSLGPVLNYRMGRDDVENNRVDDMKDIDDAVEAGIFAAYEFDKWAFGLEWLTDISDEHDGSIVKATIGYNWKVSDQWTVAPGVFATYATDNYMDTYFSVDTADSIRSGLDRYKAEADMKDVGATVFVHYTPWEKWGIAGIMSYKSLLNDAKDSPVVDDEGDKGQAFFGLMATYRWSK